MYARMTGSFFALPPILVLRNEDDGTATVQYNHRLGRVLSFSPVVGIGTPPTPHPQASVPPLPVLGGGAHSLAREGLGESQFRRGCIHCDNLYIYALCGKH